MKCRSISAGELVSDVRDCITREAIPEVISSPKSLIASLLPNAIRCHPIAEPFLTTKETGKGVGLGLAISKTIIERHGGQIEVESQPGRGTTFYVFLPVDASVAKLEELTAAATN